MILPLTYLLVFFLSCGLTGLLRRYALKKMLLDIPNQRSAHSTPMPRGGGLAFVISFLVMWVILALNKQIEPTIFFGIFAASMGVAGLGFCDDRYHLSAKVRLLGHFIAASLVLYSLGGVGQWLPTAYSHLLIWANLIAVIYLVWCINLFNFMDGIDGIAAIETITVCVGGAILYVLDGQAQAAVIPLLLASAVAGFLMWNFPPARIFMGDAGSGFLGLLIGVFSLLATQTHSVLFYGWLILNGVFFCDASVTLMRRAWRRENILEAHSSHAYQYAARHYNSHKSVSLFVGAINIFWLLPIAVIVQKQLISDFMGIFVAFAPLVILVLKFVSKR